MDGSCQSTSLTSSHGQDAAASWPPKRPAGRTKFKETRHPVYRGVRRRGLAGRWVCEVRVPGAGCKRGQRVWLGTHLSAEAAGRAHDAAMLMLRGAAPGARILNFPNSEWLLDVPLACPGSLPGVRRAAAAAVAGFQRREPASNGAAVPDLDEAAASWAASRLLPRGADNGGMPLLLSLDFEVPDAAGMFELDDICGETDLDMYYAELAEGLLMEPPPDAGPACWQSGDGRVADDDDLWSCY